MKEYTSRSLTKSSDKIPALAGVIATLQQTVGDTCHALLWERYFVKSLLWEIARDRPNGACASRPSEWRAPSWSFASIDGYIDYVERRLQFGAAELVAFAKLEECKVVPLVSNNPLGELTSVSMIWESVPIYYSVLTISGLRTCERANNIIDWIHSVRYISLRWEGAGLLHTPKGKKHTHSKRRV
jgi:hypothetical protein